MIYYHHHHYYSKSMIVCRHQLRVAQVSCLYVETYRAAREKHTSNAASAPASGRTEPVSVDAPSVNNHAPSVSCVWSVAGDIVVHIKGLSSQVGRAPNAPTGRRGTHTCIRLTSKRTSLSLLPQAATNERMAARGAAVAPAIASSDAMRRISTSY